MPEPVKEKLECEESDEVVKRCQKWKEDLESRFPKRKVRGEAIGIGEAMGNLSWFLCGVTQ